jgi:uncharacterized membrane protein YqjE
MAESTASSVPLATATKQVARRLLTIGENRLELFRVEAQEERERLLHAVLLAFAAAVFGLLASMTLSAAIVVWFWHDSPLTGLLTLTGLYVAAGACLWWRLTGWLRDWESFSASLDQLRKDRACLDKILA